MKETTRQIKKARNSSLTKAEDLASSLEQVLHEIKSEPDTIKENMPMVRDILKDLNQRVHEFNAYDNALKTIRLNNPSRREKVKS